MRDLLLGIGMVGVGYLIAKPNSYKMEHYAAHPSSSLSEYHALYPRNKKARKIDGEKIQKFWDVIVAPHRTPQTHNKEWEEQVPAQHYEEVKEIPSSTEYKRHQVYGHSFPIHNLEGYNQASSPDRVGISRQDTIPSNSDYLQNLTLSRNLHYTNYTRTIGNCCPSKELEANTDWQNSTGIFDTTSYQRNNANNRGKDASTEQKKQVKGNVDGIVATYSKYIDAQGSYLPINLTTPQEVEDFRSDVTTISSGFNLYRMLAELYFIHEMMKKGGLFQVAPHHAPDRRKRKMFPEADGLYMGVLPESGWSDKPTIETYMRMHSHDYFTKFAYDFSLDREYLLWCPFLDHEYKRLKEVDFAAFRQYIEKISFYLNEADEKLRVKEELKQLNAALKSHTKELNEAKTDSKKLVATFRKQLEAADIVRVNDYKKQLEDERKERVKEREKEIKEVVLKDYPDSIAAAKRGIRLRKELAKKIQQTQQALKKDFANSGIIITHPIEVWHITQEWSRNN